MCVVEFDDSETLVVLRTTLYTIPAAINYKTLHEPSLGNPENHRNTRQSAKGFLFLDPRAATAQKRRRRTEGLIGCGELDCMSAVVCNPIHTSGYAVARVWLAVERIRDIYSGAGIRRKSLKGIAGVVVGIE